MDMEFYMLEDYAVITDMCHRNKHILNFEGLFS